MGIFQNNAGGAWDNAKKSFEKGVEIDGKMWYKHKDENPSPPHQAAVTGDTVGDPFKDTSGPSMNILIKLTTIVALIIAPHIAEPVEGAENETHSSTVYEEATEMTVANNEEAKEEATSTATNSPNKTYIVNPAQSSFLWTGKKKIGESHSGELKLNYGEIFTEYGNLTGGQIQVNMNSLRVTDIKDPDENAELVKHLMSAEFFDVATYPTADFDIMGIKDRGPHIKGGRVIELGGDIEMKGTSDRFFTISRIDLTPEKLVASGKLELDRTKFDISFGSETLGDVIKDEIIEDEIVVDYVIVAYPFSE